MKVDHVIALRSSLGTVAAGVESLKKILEKDNKITKEMGGHLSSDESAAFDTVIRLCKTYYKNLSMVKMED